ncbi:MAG: penicillin-binding protein 2 [Raoultibacter sp.]
MLTALIVGAITLIIAVVIVIVVFNVRNATKTPQAKSKLKMTSIQSVGVAATAPTSGKHGRRGGGTSAHIKSSQSPSANPTDVLRGRFAAMGVLVAAVFGSLTVKLWSMQILQGDKYAATAQQNMYTTVATPAPRGIIYDRAGEPLVKNKTALTILADAEVANDRDVLLRLSALLGIPYNIVRKRVQDTTTGAQSQRVVANDVPLRDIAFISEHQGAFPGVTTQSRSVRHYPWGALGAHVLGYTGTVAAAELEKVAPSQELEMGDAVGKSGVEATYEAMLAGDHGQRKLVADADGNVRQVVSEIAPSKGNDIYLTINAKVQMVADKALAKLVAPDGKLGGGVGSAAALVCMDCTNGDIVALSNYPTYTPESFIGGISQEMWDQFNTEESHFPLLNRSIAGAYPAGSTYKGFTGMAGLHYGFADASRVWDCQGTWTGFGDKFPQKCWDVNGHGHTGFREGVVVSCDVVFYEIAKSFYEAGATIGAEAMQDYIKEFGFGRPTGIDLKGEDPGRVPTPTWKAEYFKDAPEEAGWKPGDMSNMAIGQGYVLATPLQLAVGYGALATGKLVKPHVFKESRNSEGAVVVKAETVEMGIPEAMAEHYALMRDSLHGVCQEDVTVSGHFAARGIDAGGKTGTAEVAGKQDFALFVCYAPFDNPKYVVACVVEEGKGGAAAASPVSAEVMDAALKAQAGTLDVTLAPLGA